MCLQRLLHYLRDLPVGAWGYNSPRHAITHPRKWIKEDILGGGGGCGGVKTRNNTLWFDQRRYPLVCEEN